MIRTVYSYRRFLRRLEAEDYIENESYVRIPKKLLADPNLTETERKLWMILASFMYKSKNHIFPSRKTLAELMDLKRAENISAISGRLQDKGYLAKLTNGRGKLYYEPFFSKDIDDSAFYSRDKDQDNFLESPRNKFRVLPVPETVTGSE